MIHCDNSFGTLSLSLRCIYIWRLPTIPTGNPLQDFFRRFTAVAYFPLDPKKDNIMWNMMFYYYIEFGLCRRVCGSVSLYSTPALAQISSGQIKLQIENKWIDIKTRRYRLYGRPIGMASASDIWTMMEGIRECLARVCFFFPLPTIYNTIE